MNEEELQLIHQLASSPVSQGTTLTILTQQVLEQYPHLESDKIREALIYACIDIS